ncbi:histone acetyltransferase subunit NuA4-domain-containing protein [Crucibulum laeve]|uniref:Chromatin modification-related protein EAF6 n=1 Tax=Crucibulum laeve TaxID=68775 RepID=A0A5C3MAA1_9AGAR|nr:histone acetyltransferase subunit NuA4-domain-containing protein [Crucibulum laeve]
MAEVAGAPSAEDRSRYETLRKELMQALPKKRAVDKQLAQIEFQIYTLEASYLTETAMHSGGNIIQGFEGYLKNQTTGRKKYDVHDSDRVFSNSSMSYQKSLELLGEGEESTATNDDYVKQPTPGVTTVVVPPAKTNELTGAQLKRQRDKEYQRKKREKTAGLKSAGGDSDDEVVSSTSTSRRPTKRARLADDD